MSIRFTETEKWQSDGWFLDLPPMAKLLFLFLCEACNLAGFMERHDRTIAFKTGIPEAELERLFALLSKSVEVSSGWLWIKNYLRHQRNLPLNPVNSSHKTIARMLLDKSCLFGHLYQDCLSISEDELRRVEGGSREPLGSISNSKGKGNKGGYRGEREKEKPEKLVFGSEGLVRMTEAEWKKLSDTHGEAKAKEYVRRLEVYIGSKGKKYKSHYFTILNWISKDEAEGGGRVNGGSITSAGRPSNSVGNENRAAYAGIGRTY